MAIDRDAFLQTIFPQDLLNPREAVLLARTLRNGMRNQLYHPRSRYDNAAWYYCVSTVERTRASEFPRRRLQDLHSAWVLPCDDVGTKSQEPPVWPSYRIETSEGNYQWGYLLDPYDVSTGTGAGYYDACLVGLADAGYNDPGCRSASRIIRLPGSLHKTGFEARVTEWNPERVWQLEELMEQFGVTPSTGIIRRSERRAEPSPVTLAEVEDPVLDWLSKAGYTLGTHNDNWVHIRCPWEIEHTSESGPSSTSYSPLDYGLYGRSFHCYHGHCQGRTIADLAKFIAHQGGPSL